jgi:hypothetical protein
MFLATVALGLGACSGDDGSPPPIDAPAIDADPNMPDAPAVCGTGGTVGFLEICTAPADCGDACTCETFHPVMRCTKTCTSNADCPAPSAGCLMPDGFCRP